MFGCTEPGGCLRCNGLSQQVPSQVPSPVQQEVGEEAISQSRAGLGVVIAGWRLGWHFLYPAVTDSNQFLRGKMFLQAVRKRGRYICGL